MLKRVKAKPNKKGREISEPADRSAPSLAITSDDAETLRARLSDRYRAPLAAFFVRRIGDPAEAEDLAQDVLLRVIDRVDLATLERPDGYLFQTAANMLTDRARRLQTRAVAQPDVEALHLNVEVLTPERVLQGKQDLQSVMAALDELPDPTRDMFILHRFEGLKYQEIADQYGVSRSAVEKRLSKALAHLTTCLMTDGKRGKT